ncbi:hypothetical protein [Streptosporangium sp. KLBMP 9127]|nr:hypothetical protein [Streptosporangium sp. KLBMP 9127]
MHDLILSWIRTAVPAGAGGLAAWLGTKGFDVAPEHALAVGASVGAAATTVYQATVSTLQRRWPLVGVLLGSTKVPTYKAGLPQGQHGTYLN